MKIKNSQSKFVKRIFQVKGGFKRPHYRILTPEGYRFVTTCDIDGNLIDINSPTEPPHSMDKN